MTQTKTLTQANAWQADRIEVLEARVAELEGDAARYRWLRNRVTFYDIDADRTVDAPNVPVLAQVSERIWYHATDDIHSLSLDALIDAALAGKEGE